MPKVSVLTPTYQHAAFIGDCIRSVLAQTMDDWQMVIVDDGSVDGTPDIAEAFQDPRIVVVRRPHEGVDGLGRAYAAALAGARGPLLAILEGDDTFPATKLEEQLGSFEDPAVVLAYGSAGLMDERGCLYARYRYAPPDAVGRNEPVGSILPALVRLNFIVATTVMIRRSALTKVGGFVQPAGIPYIDHPTWLRLATTGTFARSSRVLGNWRRYSGQVTTRSWFDPPPDRTAYLEDVAEQARELVAPDVLRALVEAIRGDQPRQYEEAMIARGRVALIEGHWRQASAIFTKLIRAGGPRTKALAVLGLSCASARTDFERLISARGRHALPSRRHLATHGQRGLPDAMGDLS